MGKGRLPILLLGLLLTIGFARQSAKSAEKAKRLRKEAEEWQKIAKQGRSAFPAMKK